MLLAVGGQECPPDTILSTHICFKSYLPPSTKFTLLS